MTLSFFFFPFYVIYLFLNTCFSSALGFITFIHINISTAAPTFNYFCLLLARSSLEVWCLAPGHLSGNR